jgi:isoleucyl-tRNA synthetase
MHHMVLALTKLLAPVLVFTADEAWEHIQHRPAGESDLASVHLSLLPKPSGMAVTDGQKEEWKLLMELRDQAMLQIDPLLRKFPKQIKPLDLEIVYRVDDALRERLQAYGPDLEDIVGAGSYGFAPKSADQSAATVEVVDRRADFKACARSWKRRVDVGKDAEYPDLSTRDAAAIKVRA